MGMIASQMHLSVMLEQ